MTNFLCEIAEKDKGKTVFVYDVNDNRCRYHRRRTKGETQPLLKHFPCLLTFSYLYPTIFSLHCGQEQTRAKNIRIEKRVRCAAQEHGLEFTLSYRDRPKRVVDFFQKHIARLINLFISFEQRDFLVDYKVTRVDEPCPLGIEIGDTFTFNVDGVDEICPAAFQSVYPFQEFMENKCLVGCPDYRTHVRYLAANDRPVEDSRIQCDAYRTKIQLKKVHGGFDVPINLGSWYLVDELMEALHLQCLTSFYVTFPYLLVLSSGGQLGYLFYDRKKAGVCCPNYAWHVNYSVSKDREGRYRYQCTQTHPRCPRKVKEGAIVDLENFEQRVPFYSGLHDLYVVIKKWDQYESSSSLRDFEVTTKFGDCLLEWEIRRV